MAGDLNSKLHVYTAMDLEIARARLDFARACDGARSIDRANAFSACARARLCMAIHACHTQIARVQRFTLCLTGTVHV